MHKYIIILLLITDFSFAQIDSGFTKSINDTIIVKTSDSSYVNIISYPKVSWIRRNEGAILGAFVGAFFAGIIAILSVYLTARSSKKQKRESETEIYCGLLYALKIELISHNENHKNLIEELEIIKHNSLLAKEIITDSPSRRISLNFLLEVRNKLIDTELVNTHILLLISTYINKCELINADIKFEKLIKVSEKFKDNVNSPESTKTYFNIIIQQIQNLQKSIPSIITYINSDLSELGKKSDIDENEYLKIVS